MKGAAFAALFIRFIIRVNDTCADKVPAPQSG
jgi:hypothetical protein